MAIGVGKYSELKKSNLVSIERIPDEQLLLYFTRFDRETGGKIDPEILRINISSIDQEISDLQGQIDNLNALKADVAALPPLPDPKSNQQTNSESNI